MNAHSVLDPQQFYLQQFPVLFEFLESALLPDKQAVKPMSMFSHEHLYRIVYQMCLKEGLKDQLGKDLASAVTLMISKQAAACKSTTDPQIFLSTEELTSPSIHSFSSYVSMNLRASALINDVFMYFARTQPKTDASKPFDVRSEVLRITKRELIDALQPQLVMLFSQFKVHPAEAMAAGPRISFQGQPLAADDVERLRLVTREMAMISTECLVFNPSIFLDLNPDTPRPPNLPDIQARFGRLETMMEMDRIQQDLWVSGATRQSRPLKRTEASMSDGGVGFGEESYKRVAYATADEKMDN
ncbi:hypothetical protein HK101_002675 [Irineochytrium annulatum]|nr:hypothetical protein HK101_002675 [Irineochytrium annulatum]